MSPLGPARLRLSMDKAAPLADAYVPEASMIAMLLSRCGSAYVFLHDAMERRHPMPLWNVS
jgi:hypothetical protein